jgi:tRNA nucleotidyltransferase (CCA-adding enzyme)
LDTEARTKASKTDDGLEVITTHINADFDALASMIAAKKLYPEAIMAFPGSQEKGLRDFFVQSTVYFLDIAQARTIDLEKVKRLILVDTREPKRIGRFSKIANKPGLDIHIYDHHPSSSGDITGSVEVIEPVGATVSLLIKILKERGIQISPDEATIMILGIYEDTGCFTFPSTTETDYEAASYLLSKGANLNMVSDMVSRDLTIEQVDLLNDLAQSASTYHINDIEVVIAQAYRDDYMPDFAVLVHKLMEMESLKVIFGLANMKNRVYLVARSKISQVNVAEITKAFGGGGHPQAASATIKDLTLIQVEDRLLKILRSSIRPSRFAKDIMSSPVVHTEPETSLQEAGQIMKRHNVSVLPLTKDGRVLGLISRGVVEKALFHDLGHLMVKDYMTKTFSQVSPDTPLNKIQEHIIEKRQRILPVVENKGLIGVITRTDLLRTLASSPTTPEYLSDQRRYYVRKKKVYHLMKEQLPKKIVERLQAIGRIADDLGYNVYAVGGFVRDLLLLHKNLDIDIVVEGDGIHFAKKYAEQHAARLHYHTKFGTAVIIFPDRFKIDVATARVEFYESPAALPIVGVSSLKVDLYRRDFTVNTLAIMLNYRHFGTLIDFFGAQSDLNNRVIRVLHNLSFIEDPTRILRAIRFEQRYGFKIATHTSNLIENAIKIKALERLDGKRLFSEVRLILQEENPFMAIQRMAQYGILQSIHPKIAWSNQLRLLFENLKCAISWYQLLFLDEKCEKWVTYFLGLTGDLDEEELSELTERLAFFERTRRIIVKGKGNAENILYQMDRRVHMKHSQMYSYLEGLPVEFLLYMMAKTERLLTKKAISLYISKLKHVKPLLDGKDLKSIGIPPGPLYREILDSLLDARLNGEVSTKADELDFVVKRWRKAS